MVMVIYLFIFPLLLVLVELVLVLIKKHESKCKEVVITIMDKRSEDQLALIARSHTDWLIM